MSSDQPDEAFQSELRSLLAAGEKIEAVKRYRDRTGASLKDAKDAVEAIGRGELRPAFQAAGEIDAEVVRLLQAGQKIEAIKLYREQTGASLKDAKDAVEAVEQERSLPFPERPSPGSAELEVVLLLERGDKIAAVKFYREKFGVGLKEAKEAVERIASERRIVAPAGKRLLRRRRADDPRTHRDGDRGGGARVNSHCREAGRSGIPRA